ncbi:MAG: 30S ribosomal protein S6 [Candidatus Roizmanbacteria bacterium]|nr:30S ribosomal protein S6 [Candidatus Roizmanbacteria bacterium]
MTSHYEFVFVVPSEPEQKQETIDRVRAVFKQNKAPILEEKDWGEKRLAYPIHNERKGHYFIWNVGIPTSNIKEIRRLLNFEQKLMRYMLLEVSAKKKAATE